MKYTEYSSSELIAYIDVRNNELKTITYNFDAREIGVEVVHCSSSGRTGAVLLPGWARKIAAYRRNRHGKIISPYRGVNSLNWTWIGESGDCKIMALAVGGELFLQSLNLETFDQYFWSSGTKVRLYPHATREVSVLEWRQGIESVSYTTLDEQSDELIRQSRASVPASELVEINSLFTRLRVWRVKNQLVRLNVDGQPRWAGEWREQETLGHLSESGCPMDYYGGWVDTTLNAIIQLGQGCPHKIYTTSHPEGREVDALTPLTPEIIGGGGVIIQWGSVLKGFCKDGVNQVASDLNIDLAKSYEVSDIAGKLAGYDGEFIDAVKTVLERLTGYERIEP